MKQPPPGTESRSTPADPATGADGRVEALSSLLAGLDEHASPTGALAAKPKVDPHQNRLAQVRLGMASSLFAALRAKHPPTAAHCLRVAIGCSSWALAKGLSTDQRDEIEVAALLHDVGKIGVPDHILHKPSALATEERLQMNRHRWFGLEILANCAAAPGILRNVDYASAHFNGARDGYDLAGDQLPIGARMIAVVDAFDAMTTDQVYRRAMSRDRALAELFEHAETQFDPQLVREFCALHAADQVKLNATVARRWIKQLSPDASNQFWSLADRPLMAGDKAVESLFHERLLENMQDAVVFVDTNLRIFLWNRGAERLSGISAASVQQKEWTPALVAMCDERGSFLDDEDCPVVEAITKRIQAARRVSVRGRDGSFVSADAHVIPVVGRGGECHGATLLLHDASSEADLEEAVQKMHEKAIRDALTGVANRAEFDRVQAEFIERHLEAGLPCALIITDIDHFKRINDNHGHQAGDEALVSFAALLQRNCRQGDLVARYGGEEFVMLCADCDNATATERAEAIRRQLEELPQPMLGGNYITSSFGVTEVQDGDTCETMLRRADRALLQAKEMGRNMVVQLGSGLHGDAGESESSGKSWLSWLFGEASEWFGEKPDLLLERELATAVPLNITAEKLRGFVADHDAEIQSVDEDHLVLKLDGDNLPLQRRSNDRPVAFLVELLLGEKRGQSQENERGGGMLRTYIRVAIRPLRNRDRRRHDAIQRARQILTSLKSYLVAQEVEASKSALPRSNGPAKSGGGGWFGLF